MPEAGLGALARQLLPAVLAVGAVFWFDRRSRRAGLDPPGFLNPWRRGLGLGALALVLAGAWLIALLVAGIGGEELVPQKPPEAIVWLASRSVLLRAGLALSAGAVEEIFFRGLLQPRAGLVLATALFASAHLSYGQPFLLVGVTLLSVLYGLLVKWRQSLFAAMAAHTLFDLVQLLVVVPALLHDFRGFWSP